MGNIGSRSNRRLTLALIALATGIATGCSRGIHYGVQYMALTAITSEFRPPKAVATERLQTQGNPKGEGLVVFVKPESGCAPPFEWLWLGQKKETYALDEASQALTPSLPLLRDAPASIVKRVGVDAETLKGLTADSLCRSPRAGP
jgi:hypothetical protein